MAEDSDLPRYQVCALRYATRERRRQDNFIGGDPHDGPMPMDYFCWLAISGERRFVINSGFTEEVAAQRKRTYLRNPVDALELLGVRAGDVEDVIITHLHYDHVGNFDRFPKARFHLQETEQRGWLVLASDVTHYYEHMQSGPPFTTAFHVGDTLEGYGRLKAVAPSPDRIVPGHDPLVMWLYPPPSPELKGVAMRLGQQPQHWPSNA